MPARIKDDSNIMTAHNRNASNSRIGMKATTGPPTQFGRHQKQGCLQKQGSRQQHGGRPSAAETYRNITASTGEEDSQQQDCQKYRRV
jgi:hypothetical protein